MLLVTLIKIRIGPGFYDFFDPSQIKKISIY